MKKLITFSAALALAILTGCSTALVSNVARSTTTAPDGTVTERYAQNKIRAFGDRAVEQNLKGSLADATAEDLSAGIQESAQKSESGAVIEFMGRTVETVGRIGEAYLTRSPVAQGPITNCVGPGCADVELPADDTNEKDSATEFLAAGYDGVPGPTGEGVYGRPSCTKCKAYKAAHPDVKIINIDVANNKTDMWAALGMRNHPGGTVDLPVLITSDAYVSPAK